MQRTVFATLLAVLATALVCGCGGGTGQTTSVSGTVKLDGKPLSQGKITFRGTDKDATAYTGEIKEGRYALSAAVGTQTVQIDSFVAAPGADTTGIGQRNAIPDRYNAKSELTAAVAASGPNEFNFDLTSK